MSSSTAQNLPTPAPEPAVIVFGLDHSKKPHASVFGADVADRAEASAAFMDMASLRIGSPDQQRLAALLPAGKLFSSGRAFVPFVKASLFEDIVKLAPPAAAKTATTPKLRLVASSGGTDSRPASHGKPTPSIEPDFPTDWSKIKIGSIVLAIETGEEGWYESIVMEMKEGDWLYLQWRYWPDLPKFLRRRSEVGLMPQPKAAT